MSTQFEMLFSPLQIRHKTTKNRIVSTAHVTVFAENGVPGERYRRYYLEKAKGGAGMLICFGSSSVHPTSPALDWHVVELYHDRVIPYLQKFSESMHEHGVVLLAQITHRGRRGHSNLSWERLLGPSAVKEPNHREVPGILKKDEIEMIVRAFADAAVRVKKGGFDGVELSAAHCHLIDQFWGPHVNFRNDEFGGELENRLRFGFMVIERVREAIGDDCILGIRITGDDFIEGGLNNSTMCQIAQRVSEHGMVDYFNVIGASAETLATEAAAVPSMNFPLACFSPLAGSIREVVAVGRINDPVVAERVLQEGQGDLVAMTRALIADPYLPTKAREGRLDDIRQCMGYNEGCIDRQYRGMPISCVQNPVIGNEAEWAELPRAARVKKVVVIGGGPAGMECARVARLRGHEVVLFEKADALGGQLNIATLAPKRTDFDGAGRWLEIQARKLGVEIRLKTEATLELVLAEKPNTVVLATGAVPLVPPIPGLATSSYAVSAWDVLLGRAPSGARVLVLDDQGGMESVGAAEFLLDQGREVEIVSPHYSVGEDLGPTNKPPVYARLFSKGAKMQATWELRAVENGTVRLRNVYGMNEVERTDIDVLVYSYGGRSLDTLAGALEGKVDEFYNIGDSYAPRSLHHAILEGHKYGRLI
jgi:2,4-dienoyl-CoA reductase-like NADH-dependent reductase (Old Yellow Enzyme family)/thioredoxin reductase